jgi:hypothetical protein
MTLDEEKAKLRSLSQVQIHIAKLLSAGPRPPRSSISVEDFINAL